MTRLIVVVEGQSEEAFVKNVLIPHLQSHDVFAVPIIVTTRRDSKTGKKLDKGGGNWGKWGRDIRRVLGDQPGAWVTTLFDLYGLPHDFPGLGEHGQIVDTAQRAQELEQSMLGAVKNDPRFVPYLQRHEFEALVLASLDELRGFLDTPTEIDALRQHLGGARPEEINDGLDTAPSKRLAATLSGYQTLVHGVAAIELAGLGRLRSLCPRFDAWLTRLEGLGHLAAS